MDFPTSTYFFPVRVCIHKSAAFTVDGFEAIANCVSLSSNIDIQGSGSYYGRIHPCIGILLVPFECVHLQETNMCMHVILHVVDLYITLTL